MPSTNDRIDGARQADQPLGGVLHGLPCAFS